MKLSSRGTRLLIAAGLLLLVVGIVVVGQGYRLYRGYERSTSMRDCLRESPTVWQAEDCFRIAWRTDVTLSCIQVHQSISAENQVGAMHYLQCMITKGELPDVEWLRELYMYCEFPPDEWLVIRSMIQHYFEGNLNESEMKQLVSDSVRGMHPFGLGDRFSRAALFEQLAHHPEVLEAVSQGLEKRQTLWEGIDLQQLDTHDELAIRGKSPALSRPPFIR